MMHKFQYMNWKDRKLINARYNHPRNHHVNDRKMNINNNIVIDHMNTSKYDMLNTCDHFQPTTNYWSKFSTTNLALHMLSNVRQI